MEKERTDGARRGTGRPGRPIPELRVRPLLHPPAAPGRLFVLATLLIQAAVGAWLVVPAGAASGATPGPAAADAIRPAGAGPPELRDRIADALLTELDAAAGDEFLSVILSVDPPLDIDALETEIEARGIRTRWQRHRFVLERAKEHAEGTQAALLAALEEEAASGEVGEIRPFWVTNAIACRTRPSALARLLAGDTAHAGGTPGNHPSSPGSLAISRVQPDSPVFLKEAIRESSARRPEDGLGSNLVAIRVEEVWARGLTGAGRLVGHFDAGAEGDHVSFADRWRGAREGVPWEEAWFDPFNGTDFPYGTDGGHGTGTLSVMVGTRPEGPPLGVAYEAEWIAAGVLLIPGIHVSAILSAFEWAVDPDGDGSTIDDVPDVINHSWGTHDDCATEYWDAIDLLEAAGVVNIIAVDNSGPLPATVNSPESRADSPYENFGVGGVDTNEPGYPVRATSGRGPSPCDGVSIKPELVGPGYRVPGAGTNDNLGVFWSGTSFAAPHVSGVVALLRQLDPSLTVREIKHALLATAQDVDVAGEDNNTGWGLVDATAAVEYIERHVSTHPPPFVATGPTGPAPVGLLRWAPPRYLGRGEVPTLTGYRIYRTPRGEPFGEEPIAEVDVFPTEFWDREAGSPQNYIVTARYADGAESEPTVPIGIDIVPDLAADPTPPEPGPADGVPREPSAAGFGFRVIPNPFRGATDLFFGLRSGGRVRLDVWDSSGRRVRTLLDEELAAGSHSAAWSGSDDDGRRLPAGLYFVRLTAPDDGSFTLRVARLR